MSEFNIALQLQSLVKYVIVSIYVSAAVISINIHKFILFWHSITYIYDFERSYQYLKGQSQCSLVM